MSEPRYPLTARLERGRVRHIARYLKPDSDTVATLCGKRGRAVPTAAYTPVCAACAARPNPQDCRSYGGTE